MSIPKAFLSHQSKDKPFVEALGAFLRLNGVDVFIDAWDIFGGDSIPREIEEALDSCDLFLYVLSPAAAESKWVQAEYHAYLYRKLNDQRLRIIPILREQSKAPPLIAPLRALDFRGTETAHLEVGQGGNSGQELLKAIFRTPQNRLWEDRTLRWRVMNFIFSL